MNTDVGARQVLPPAEPLEQRWASVQAEPWAHDFFALLREIDALHPDLPRLGTALRPGQEAVRLGQAPELDFAPAAVAACTHDRAGLPRVLVRFFGLLGPQGPMPLQFTEHVRERARHAGDSTAQAFLDLFHHRMLALFYRAWAHTQPVVHRDRPPSDRYAAWVGASFGLDKATAGRGSVPDLAKLYMAGPLGGRSRHAEGLARLLAAYFGVPVQVQERVAHWLPMHAQDRSRLGATRLGVSAVAGHKVWDRQSRFRLRLGPLGLDRYLALLPGGAAWWELVDWVRLYVGHDLLWDVQLCLRGPDVPAARLGRHVRLGLTSWLPGGRRPAPDRDDLHLPPSAAAARPLPGAPHG